MFLFKSIYKSKLLYKRNLIITTDQLGMSYTTHNYIEEPVFNSLLINSLNLQNVPFLLFLPSKKVKLFEGFYYHGSKFCSSLNKLNIYYKCNEINKKTNFTALFVFIHCFAAHDGA